MTSSRGIQPHPGQQGGNTLTEHGGHQAGTAIDAYRSASGYGHGGASGLEGDLRQTLYEYLRILYKRRWLIASVVVTALSIAMLYTLMMPPLYTATVRIQIDRESAKVVQGGDVTPNDSASAEFMRTQIELLQSRSMAERVAVIVKLLDDPEFFKSRGLSLFGAAKRLLGSQPSEAAPGAKSAQMQQVYPIIRPSLSVLPVAGSRLVDISYVDPAPQRAQRVVNAYAEAYLASNVDKRFEANSYAKTFLEDQLAQLKLRLEQSEKAALDFAGQAQIIEATEKTSSAEASLSAANAALGVLISERIKLEQNWRQLERSDAISNPLFLNNAVIDGMRSRRNALVSEYQEKLEIFKPDYPVMVQITNKIKEIDRQLAGEIKTIRAATKASFDAAESQEDQMKKRVEELKSEMLELQKKMISYNTLKREVDTNRGLYNSLLQRYKEIDVASGVGANNVFVVDRAVTPSSPSSPNLMRALALSLALGLGLGLSTAYILERLDDRLNAAAEIERVTGLAMLGIIPREQEGAILERSVEDPRSAISEAYRSLATSLQFATSSGLPRTIVVTSAGPAEGKSITSYAISRHFALIGLKVLLVDADLRKPSLHTKLGADNSIGLSNYLAGACTPPDAIQSTDVANLALMSSGPLPPNAADLIAGSRFHSLLSQGQQVFDLIVIDAPPVLGLADSQLLSSAAAATIFVVGAGQARSAMVRDALRRLNLARAPVIGAVVTKYYARAAGYDYGYGNSYGYEYGYGASSGAKPVETRIAGPAAAEQDRTPR